MRSGLLALPSRHVGIALAAAHFCLGLLVTLDPRSTHDEGLLMYGFSRALGDAFLPCFFFQKLKPALALVYLPFASLGLGAYLVAHLAVASAAVALVHATARALGHERPWVPALVVALSPLYTWSGLVGVSNSDGVAAIALFLYLLVARKSLLGAGLVLGVLPWIRYECAVFSVVLALYVFYRHRSRVFLAGCAAWPLAYLASGALYHRDILWFLHYMPNVSKLTPDNPVWMGEFARHDIGTGVLALAMVSPAVFFLLLVRRSRLVGVEKALGAFTAVFFGLFLATHVSPRDIGPAFALGFSSRYAVVPVIAVGLLLGRALEALEREAAPRLRDTAAAAALLGLGWLLRTRGLVAPLWAAASTGALVAASRGGATRLALASVITLLVGLPWSFREALVQAFPMRDERLDQAASWLEANRGAIGAEIYTNHKMLGPYLARTGRLAGVRVRFMLAADHHYELVHLTNDANGQRDAVIDVVPRAVFGDVVMPDALLPSKVPAGTTFVLIDDARTKLILPPETWASRLSPLHATRGFSVSNLAP